MREYGYVNRLFIVLCMNSRPKMYPAMIENRVGEKISRTEYWLPNQASHAGGSASENKRTAEYKSAGSRAPNQTAQAILECFNL